MAVRAPASAQTPAADAVVAPMAPAARATAIAVVAVGPSAVPDVSVFAGVAYAYGSKRMLMPLI